MRFSDEMLMAYADDELDAQTRAGIEDAMRTDPEIVRKIEGYRALQGKLRSTYDAVLHESVPDRLIAAARTAPTERRSNVVPIRRKPPTKSWPQWASVAASLVVGVLIGQFALRSFATGPFEVRNGQIVASGELAQALSHRLASENAAGAQVQLGVSFREKGGNYCRTFLLRDTGTVTGLACRDPRAWHVQVLAQGTEPAGDSAGYRPAASAMPRAVLDAVADRIAGDPLDAAGETAARARDWKAPE